MSLIWFGIVELCIESRRGVGERLRLLSEDSKEGHESVAEELYEELEALPDNETIGDSLFDVVGGCGYAPGDRRRSGGDVA